MNKGKEQIRQDDEPDKERLLKALHVCEEICAHNEHLPRDLNTDLEKKFHNALNTIYRVLHVARIPRCIDKHENWEEEFHGLYERLIEPYEGK